MLLYDNFACIQFPRSFGRTYIHSHTHMNFFLYELYVGSAVCIGRLAVSMLVGMCLWLWLSVSMYIYTYIYCKLQCLLDIIFNMPKSLPIQSHWLCMCVCKSVSAYVILLYLFCQPTHLKCTPSRIHMKIVYNNKSFSFVLLCALIILLLLFFEREWAQKNVFSFLSSFVLVPYYMHICECFCVFFLILPPMYNIRRIWDVKETYTYRFKTFYIIWYRVVLLLLLLVVVYLVVCDHRERHIERRCLQFLFLLFCFASLCFGFSMPFAFVRFFFCCSIQYSVRVMWIFCDAMLQIQFYFNTKWRRNFLVHNLAKAFMWDSAHNNDGPTTRHTNLDRQ